MKKPSMVDHDDGSMTFDTEAQQWVAAQIVIQGTPTRVLPSGVRLVDNSGGRRVVGFKTSNDTKTWSCVPSVLNKGNPFCPDKWPTVLPPGFPAVVPDTADPPELEFCEF